MRLWDLEHVLRAAGEVTWIRTTIERVKINGLKLQISQQ